MKLSTSLLASDILLDTATLQALATTNMNDLDMQIIRDFKKKHARSQVKVHQPDTSM